MNRWIDTSWMADVRFLIGWRDWYADLACSINEQAGCDPYVGELPW